MIRHARLPRAGPALGGYRIRRYRSAAWCRGWTWSFLEIEIRRMELITILQLPD
jgi:hypothetical protein